MTQNERDRLEVHRIAAPLTAAVIGNLPDNNPLDMEIESSETRGENLQAARLQSIFYHFVAGTLTSDAWKLPGEGAAEVPLPDPQA